MAKLVLKITVKSNLFDVSGHATIHSDQNALDEQFDFRFFHEQTFEERVRGNVKEVECFDNMLS